MGYTLFASRSVRKEELIPTGWQPQLPPNTDPQQYTKYKKFWRPFAKWLVYQRNQDKDDSHGPKRFSLLYIGGEGVATYQAIYSSTNQVPAALAIIQPGTGFGLNWTNFRGLNGHLYWVVNSNPAGLPQTILYGGCANEYGVLGWPGYEYAGTIRPYYREGGMVTIWTK